MGGLYAPMVQQAAPPSVPTLCRSSALSQWLANIGITETIRTARKLSARAKKVREYEEGNQRVAKPAHPGQH
jgi:hypothetical protein